MNSTAISASSKLGTVIGFVDELIIGPAHVAKRQALRLFLCAGQIIDEQDLEIGPRVRPLLYRVDDFLLGIVFILMADIDEMPAVGTGNQRFDDSGNKMGKAREILPAQQLAQLLQTAPARESPIGLDRLQRGQKRPRLFDVQQFRALARGG